MLRVAQYINDVLDGFLVLGIGGRICNLLRF